MTETYEIHVKGRLSGTTLAAFEELDACVAPVKTVFCGAVKDQAALHGILDRFQSFGLELVEVRRLPDAVLPTNDRPAKLA